MDSLQPKIDDLPITPVDAHSPVPLYHQIHLDLKRLIQDGILPPGATLPPELELCQAYGVGRQTMRQAIAALVDDGLVERFAGRGTFVRSQPDRMKFYLDRSFTQQMSEMGRTAHSRLVCQEMRTIDANSPPALAKWRGQPALHLERLRFGDEEPICYQGTTLLAARCPGIERFDFGRQSLYAILASHYQLFITRIDHVVRAVAADEYRAELLEILPGAPLLYVGTTTYLESGELIELTASHYRADRYEYSTSQTCCEE